MTIFMKEKAAKIISIAFHPLIFTITIPFLIAYRGSASVLYGVEWMLFSFGFIFLFLIVFFFLQPVQFLTDFDISKREKRPVFYAAALFFAVLYFIIALLFKGIFFPLSIVALGIILGIAIFELANFYVKVSIHSGIATSFAIAIGLLYGFVPFLLFCWIPFAVAWSRLALKKHSRREIITGALLGGLVVLLTFAIGEIIV